MKLVSCEVTEKPNERLSIIFEGHDRRNFTMILDLDSLTPTILARRLRHMAELIEDEYTNPSNTHP